MSNVVMRRHLWIIVALLLLGLGSWLWSGPRVSAPDGTAPGERPVPAQADAGTSSAREAAGTAAHGYPGFLPAQAHAVLDAIARGGPHPYRQDGAVFQNRERLLPPQPRGYYREYTVDTPGSGDRGPRRIVTGGHPPVEYWYTDDHYRSFRRFQVSP
jgi:guanyl-specific ribonuclease Sa